MNKKTRDEARRDGFSGLEKNLKSSVILMSYFAILSPPWVDPVFTKIHLSFYFSKKINSFQRLCPQSKGYFNRFLWGKVIFFLNFIPNLS
jgi:hypothetical protein